MIRPGYFLIAYCRLDLAAHSRARLEGKEWAESIHLETGEVSCDITPGKGSFTLRTSVGEVSVRGTRFTVKLNTHEGGDPMLSKYMVVKVLIGSVLVTGGWGTVELTAGQDLLFAQENPQAGKSGTTIGSLTLRKGAEVRIKADGEEAPRLYTVRWLMESKQFDPDLIKQFQAIPIGSRIEVQWTRDNERMRISNVKVLKAAPAKEEGAKEEGKKPPEVKVKKGTTTGILTESKNATLLMIKPDGAATAVFHTVRWLKESKQFDPELIKQFEKIPVGSRIEVQWVIDSPAGHRRIHSVKVLKNADSPE